MPIIVSTHPRTKNELNKKNNIKYHKLIKFIQPLGFFDYIKLQKNSYVVLSDSGTISEESSILKLKSLNLRYTHERHEAMEQGSVMMVGLEYRDIKQAIMIIKNGISKPADLDDYLVNDFSDKVIKFIISYKNYINYNIWKKF